MKTALYSLKVMFLIGIIGIVIPATAQVDQVKVIENPVLVGEIRKLAHECIISVNVGDVTQYQSQCAEVRLESNYVAHLKIKNEWYRTGIFLSGDADGDDLATFVVWNANNDIVATEINDVAFGNIAYVLVPELLGFPGPSEEDGHQHGPGEN